MQTNVMPELGIYTSEFLEIFVYIVTPGIGFPRIDSFRLSNGKYTLQYGEQSELFQTYLFSDQITQVDTGDFGHDDSQTLTIRPGPPYSLEDRRAIHELLSQFMLQTDSVLSFWSVGSLNTDYDLKAYTVLELLRATAQWPLDSNKQVLWLVNQISYEHNEEKFIDTFRLLESVLELLEERDFKLLRFDSNVDDEALIDLVTKSNGLGQKLRYRIERLNNPPDSVLKELWKLMNIKKGYNPNEVCSQIAHFRNNNVHFDKGLQETLPLPWEMPSIRAFTFTLLELIQAIILDEKS